MSILSINEETFKLRAIDFMEDPNKNFDCTIWPAARDLTYCNYQEKMLTMHQWTTEKTQEIRDRVLALESIKPTGHQIRKILKDVLGINLSVRVNKYMFRDQGTVSAYYDIAEITNPVTGDRSDYHIDNPALPYIINSIRLVLYYPKMNVPEEGLKF